MTYLKQFMSARYGKDVKQNFHDCVLEINNEAENATNLSNETKTRQDLLEQKYNEQIKNIASSEPQNAEIVDARRRF